MEYAIVAHVLQKSITKENILYRSDETFLNSPLLEYKQF